MLGELHANDPWATRSRMTMYKVRMRKSESYHDNVVANGPSASDQNEDVL